MCCHRVCSTSLREEVVVRVVGVLALCFVCFFLLRLAPWLCSQRCVCVALLPCVWQLDETYSFEKYCAEFNKPHVVGTPEYENRREVFTHNLKNILAHNADPTKTWKVRAPAPAAPA